MRLPLYSGKFSWGPISWKVSLQSFRDLIFADTHTHTHCALYNCATVGDKKRGRFRSISPRQDRLFPMYKNGNGTGGGQCNGKCSQLFQS